MSASAIPPMCSTACCTTSPTCGSRSTTPTRTGFTDHVFALMHLLGFRFAPRIRDLGETKLYVPQGVQAYLTLRPLIGGTLNIKHVRAHWDDILRPQLDQAGHRHRLADAAQARQLPAPERTGRGPARAGPDRAHAVHPDWLQSVELRRRVHAGLNKGEARNSLTRAVFFNRLGKSGIGASSSSATGPAASTRDGGYRAVEHGVRNAPPVVGRGRQAGGRRAAAIPVAAGLGAHQPNRRLRLAAEPQTGKTEVSALTDARKTLAYDFSEFCGLPKMNINRQNRVIYGFISLYSNSYVAFHTCI